jgi:hypothetical protein
VAADAVYDNGGEVTKIEQVKAVREIIGNHEKLKSLDIKVYQQELQVLGQE